MKNLENWAIWEILNKLKIGEKVKFRNYTYKYVIIERVEDNFEKFKASVYVYGKGLEGNWYGHETGYTTMMLKLNLGEKIILGKI
ncbi:hypothetical protein [Fusobacterium sp. HMSC073F01]|uniref:hypothetical protein n=1 Tax=Fusobacterium sp. HMSC073F01 TaxID=1739251 RepID=UPI0008A4488C|nr:hypothetical protein [Fusobacterium sp. HMSC073F01]OFL94325.1 hypothetical protein HMPREF2747_16100 [Fusobacterium sp. HMSC073F01]